MNEKTCAACDCKLDSNSIKVKLRGEVVEVCCIECAEKLNEAQAALIKELAEVSGEPVPKGVNTGLLGGLFKKKK